MLTANFACGFLDSIANPTVGVMTDVSLREVKLKLGHVFATTNAAFVTEP